ncbi:MAG: hypothetical protein ACFCVB_19985 [Nodosilinea sp.]
MVAKSDSGAIDNQNLSQDVRSDLQSHSEPQHLPLNPDAQRKIKALISQIRIALQRQQLDIEVYKQLHQLAEDLRVARPYGPAHTAQRLEMLVKRVEYVLSTGKLTTEVQKELADLLSLVSAMHDYPNHISELELAVSALLPGAFTAVDALPDRQTVGSSAQSPAGMKLARRLRNHLRLKTRQHPFPIQSLLSASGSGQNRLFSGLSWFLLIFSLLPALAYGGVMILGIDRIESLEQDLALVEADRDRARADRRRQERRAIFLEGNFDRVGTRIEGMATRNQNLRPAGDAPAAGTSSWIGYQRLVATDIQVALTERLTAALGNVEGTELTQQTQAQLAEQLGDLDDYTALAELLISLRQLTAAVGETDSPPALNDQPTEDYSFATLNQLLNAAEGEVQAQRSLIAESRSILGEDFAEDQEGSRDANASQSPSDEEVADSGSNNGSNNVPASNRDRWNSIIDGLINTANQVDLPLMLAVVSAGALGGFVSVIVRAGDLVQNSEEKPLDLFFLGFFRPVVGMTFAFFLVAMLESGILSGIFTLGRSDQGETGDRNIYLYIAISFVAGFSERLVRDFVSQTERQITGGSASQRESDR